MYVFRVVATLGYMQLDSASICAWPLGLTTYVNVKTQLEQARKAPMLSSRHALLLRTCGRHRAKFSASLAPARSALSTATTGGEQGAAGKGKTPATAGAAAAAAEIPASATDAAAAAGAQEAEVAKAKKRLEDK